MQILITKVGFTRCTVNEFEKEVNDLLQQGFYVEQLSIDRGLRFVCIAVLDNDDSGSSSSNDSFEDDIEDDIEDDVDDNKYPDIIPHD